MIFRRAIHQRFNWRSKNASQNLGENRSGLQGVTSGRRKKRLIFSSIGILLAGGITAIVFGILMWINRSHENSAMTTSNNSNNSIGTLVTSYTTVHTTSYSSATSQTSSLTTSTPIATTACPHGFTLSSSGSCVDLMTDMNNCGSLGYVCSSSFTNCSMGQCVGNISSNIAWNLTVIIWDGSTSIDDVVATVSLPFNVTLYSYTTSDVQVSSNGVICLDLCDISFANTNLSAAHFSGPAAMIFWDDLIILFGYAHTVYYQVEGYKSNRTLTFNFRTTKAGMTNDVYHFQAKFFERKPGVIEFHYTEAPDKGASATIGVQATSSGPAMVYSYDQINSITNNLTITFDTVTNLFIG